MPERRYREFTALITRLHPEFTARAESAEDGSAVTDGALAETPPAGSHPRPML
ncbi:hypothetical protein [Nitrococcus mobilis]|uniref:Uncharacterized protein n=1 Tax=Nitrococcus mobilis Nb-231 TaxID=314278 RepID=A4BR35_9GAMM|nr:hypothetical protein [Nitrococcus mobilis]EAR22035.1 hypothetical protein NB231_06591 [Nitrococcus mobilis Nb-231]